MTALVSIASVAAASAATLHVTSSADDGSAGTLRNVIGNAQSGDTIVIDPGVQPHLTGASGIIMFAVDLSSLTIEGQGARSTTITGNGVASTFSLVNDSQTGPAAPALTIQGVTLAGGGGADGGAIFLNVDTSATLNAVTLSGNAVTNSNGVGGAVEDRGMLTLNGVTAVGNTASTDGGAIFVSGIAQINNSTITKNTAISAGGGIYNDNQSILVGDTLAGNSVTKGAGGNLESTDGGTTTLTDTIATGGRAATGSNCAAVSGSFISDGHNLESTMPDQCGLTPSTDLVGDDPLLDPLGDYGGPTDTMALAPGSPAIGTGTCAASTLNGVDQRGLPRPGAGETRCDIGAYELQNGTSASVTCPATALDQPTQCTATVTAPSGTAPAPSGSISLTSSGAGAFASGGKCTLAPTSPGASSSSCALAYTPSALGSQTITLTYAGDDVFTGTTASTTLPITLRATTVAVACAPNPASLGVPATCSATVTDPLGAGGGPPSGTVSFSGTAGSFGATATCMLSGSGAAESCAVPLTPRVLGAKRVTATYAGDAAHAGTSGSTSLNVKQGPQGGITAQCAPGTVAPGTSTACTATVDGSSPPATGSVAFTVKGATAVSGGDRCTLHPAGSGAACAVIYKIGSDATGTYNVTAAYGGDAKHPAAGTPTSFATTPVAGKAVNATVVSGTVLIELPSAHSFSPLNAHAGSPVPVVGPIKGATVAVPMGSTVDTTKGRLQVATAASFTEPVDKPPTLQNATLSSSIFTIQQMTAKQARRHLKHGKRLFGIPPTYLRLHTPPRATSKARCRRAGAPGKGVVRAISGTGKGLFRTVGANSITTIRDATWIVSDRCDGTLTEVGRGSATVTSTHPTHKHERPVVIGAGQGVLIKGRFV